MLDTCLSRTLLTIGRSDIGIGTTLANFQSLGFSDRLNRVVRLGAMA